MGGVASIGTGDFDPRMLCVALYMLGASIPAMIIPARFSETPDARWILLAGPNFHAGRFNSGAVQAHLFTMHFPVMMIAAIITLAFGGTTVLPDVVYALSATLLISLVAARLSGTHVPFARRVPTEASAEFLFESMLILGSGLVAGTIHVCAYIFDLEIVLYLLPLAILPACAWVARTLRDLPPPQPLR